MATLLAVTLSACQRPLSLRPRAAPAGGKSSAAGTAACQPKAKPANFDFTLKDLHGKEIPLRSRGRSCCWTSGDVVRALQDGDAGLRRAARQVQGAGLRVVSLLTQDDPANAPAFIEKFKMNYQVLDANDQTALEDAMAAVRAPDVVPDQQGRADLPDAHRLLAEEQFEKEIQALLAASGAAAGAGGLPGPRVLGGLAPLFRPLRNRIHDGHQRPSLLRQRVLDPDGRLGNHRALDDAAVLELLEPLAEHPVGDVGDGLAKGGEPAPGLQQHVDDRAAPAPADQLAGAVEVRAELSGPSGSRSWPIPVYRSVTNAKISDYLTCSHFLYSYSVAQAPEGAGHVEEEWDMEGLILTRLVFGPLMALHGAQKLFGWLGGYGPTARAGHFEQLGFRPGRLFALAAGLGEFTSGLLVTLGFLGPGSGRRARWVSVMPRRDDDGARRQRPVFAATNGLELPLLYAATASTPGAHRTRRMVSRQPVRADVALDARRSALPRSASVLRRGGEPGRAALARAVQTARSSSDVVGSRCSRAGLQPRHLSVGL